MNRIIRILYALALVNLLAYLINKQSAFMFAGGILMIIASIMLIIKNSNK